MVIDLVHIPSWARWVTVIAIEHSTTPEYDKMLL
jgi:hypothetical protein